MQALELDAEPEPLAGQRAELEHAPRVVAEPVSRCLFGVGASDKSQDMTYDFAQQLADLTAVVDALARRPSFKCHTTPAARQGEA